MKYNVSWIINGELNIENTTQKEAETEIETRLKKIINENQNLFNKLGAIAIQGNATLIDKEKNN